MSEKLVNKKCQDCGVYVNLCPIDYNVCIMCKGILK